jgi:acetylornithine deacetylase/succinyl-diaminopimelate desuccinylase-like protein
MESVTNPMTIVRLLMLAACSFPAAAQTPVRTYVEAHKPQILRELTELLAVPNVASDHENIRRNADLIRKIMRQRGVPTRLLETPGAPPVVFGEIKIPGAQRTLVFYAHYDGQPVDAKEWAGGNPFQPTLRSAMIENDGRVLPMPVAGQRIDPEWRLYARSSSDDKAPIVAMLAALDALKANGGKLTSNVKFFFEGEEEGGSPHLMKTVRDNAAILGGDVWLICDGPVSQNRQQQIYFGARGVTGLEITVYGPRRELHSGHYGNWAPNPAMMLARLLASMRDDDGRVLIEGFYDGMEPLGLSERNAIASAPDVDSQLKRELGLVRTERDARKLMSLINEPSLNVRGLQSVAVGPQARNVIPATATASIDVRLVKGIDHKDAEDRVILHIRKQGYYVTDADPDMQMRLQYPRIAKVSVSSGGYNAARTSMELPIARDVAGAVEAARGPVVRMPTLGGSVPLYILDEVLKVPMIGIPIVNHDNSQHSFNENVRLQNLWDGIETMAALMTMK